MIKTPFVAMWGILLTGIMLTFLAVGTALLQPWFGLTLALENDHIVVDTIRISLTNVQKGEVVQSISSVDGRNKTELIKQDIIEDPDQLETYQRTRQFFSRQNHFANMLSQPQISLNFANGNNVVLNVEPTRPLNSLPLVFWIQILVGLCSFF